ncbi:Spore coat protein SA [subsurface metagenome]
MNIAYIALKGLPLGGGIEKYTEEIGSRLVKKGHKVTAYSMRHFDAKNGVYRGIYVKTLPCINHKCLQKISLTFLASFHSLLNSDTDIVHFHAIGPSLFSFMPKFKKRKAVVQAHGIEWKRAKWGFGMKQVLKMCELAAVKFPDLLTVVSKVQQKYYKEKYGINSIFIPPGVNIPTKRKPNLILELGLKGNDYILFAARLVREKGAHYLIQAYNNLKTDLKLVIAGDAQFEDQYKNKLLGLASGNKDIIFPGFVQGELKEELFSNAYLFACPSELEGLSISVLEAMSYGNCCLVSNIPENLEAIDKFGYSFRNQDIDNLKEELCSLINNRNKVNKVKEVAKNYVLANYSWDSVTDKMENLYIDLLNGKKYK